MALDQSKVGEHIANQMEALEADYGEECQVGDILTIVEVIGPHGSHVRIRSSNLRPHSVVGLLETAKGLMMGTLKSD